MPQHLAGIPVEELLLAACVATAPLIALVSIEVRSRVTRLSRALRRTKSADALPDTSSGRQ